MTQPIPCNENTCAVVVTHQPSRDFASKFLESRKQFRYFVIVDNASDDAEKQMLCDLSDGDYVKLIRNPQNLGVAVALNQAVALASTRNFKWLVTFDQDSRLLPDVLQTLTHVYSAAGDSRTLVGVNYWSCNKNSFFLACASSTVVFKRRKTLITSGMLISLETFGEIGGFREDYFIDSVDHEFCLRARSRGYQVLITCKPGMSHSIGSTRLNASWLRRKLSFDHSPTRKYYIARNAIVTIKTYFRKEPVWSACQGFRLIADLISILLFEKEKLRKLAAFSRGFCHGVGGKMGPIEATCPNGV